MIYSKTELGKTALHDKSLSLTPKQRSTFIMFDGKRSVEEVLKLTLALGVTADDVSRLVELALLAPVEVAMKSGTLGSTPTLASRVAVQDATPEFGPAATARSDGLNNEQVHYSKAYPIAVRLTSNLGLRGFRLNLSVEAAANLEALKNLAPKIKEAIGVEKFKELEDALYR